MIFIEQILLTRDAMEKAKERVAKLKYEADYWPTQEDINKVIIPNIHDMYMYIQWTLETCHSPSSIEEMQSQAVLRDILKKYFVLDDGGEVDAEKLSEIITMSYDQYENLCAEAEQNPVRASGWPTVKEMNQWIRDGLEKAVKKFIYYLETAPAPATDKEKEAKKYMNMVIRSRVIFVDEVEK